MDVLASSNQNRKTTTLRLPARCNPNEDTDGKFIPAEHIVQFVDKAAYTLRGSFSRHHRETIELDSMDED